MERREARGMRRLYGAVSNVASMKGLGCGVEAACVESWRGRLEAQATQRLRLGRGLGRSKTSSRRDLVQSQSQCWRRHWRFQAMDGKSEQAKSRGQWH